MTSNTPPSWAEVLDDLECRATAAENALDNGELLPIEPFTPPADIEPLPAHLHERALNVLRHHHEVEQRIENLKLSVSRDLGNATRANRAGSAFADSATPRYFDSKV